jgi:hypothetical protein
VKPQTPHLRRAAQAKPPRGFVLVIALIILAVVGLISTASIRLALNGDTASQALRSNGSTQQAAEAALRWCELQVRQALWDVEKKKPVAFDVRPPPDTDEVAMDATKIDMFKKYAVPVPLNVLNNAGLVAFKNPPQCLAQRRALAAPLGSANVNAANMLDIASPEKVMDVVQVTTRAFSPDFSDTAGSASGGDVWIKSTMIVLKYAP